MNSSANFTIFNYRNNYIIITACLLTCNSLCSEAALRKTGGESREYGKILKNCTFQFYCNITDKIACINFVKYFDICVQWGMITTINLINIFHHVT